MGAGAPPHPRSGMGGAQLGNQQDWAPCRSTQLHLACRRAHGRGCFWGSVPAAGQVCGCSAALSLQSPDTMLGGVGGRQLSAGSWAHHAPTSTADRGRGMGPGGGGEAGGGPYLFLFMIRMCAAATQPAGAALCTSLPRNVCRQVGSGRGASF